MNRTGGEKWRRRKGGEREEREHQPRLLNKNAHYKIPFNTTRPEYNVPRDSLCSGPFELSVVPPVAVCDAHAAHSPFLGESKR